MSRPGTGTIELTKGGQSIAVSGASGTLSNPVTNFSFAVAGVSYNLQVKFGEIDSSQGYVDGNTLNVWEGATGYSAAVQRPGAIETVPANRQWSRLNSRERRRGQLSY